MRGNNLPRRRGNAPARFNAWRLTEAVSRQRGRAGAKHKSVNIYKSLASMAGSIDAKSGMMQYGKDAEEPSHPAVYAPRRELDLPREF
jgi:hypothetical protein